MQRHWVVVLLPSPTESRSSTSAKLAIMWNRGVNLGRSQKAATRKNTLRQSNLCRHQKSRWVRCRVVDTSIRLRRDLPHGSVSRIGLSRPTNGWRTGAAPGATKCLSGQFLPRALKARGRRLACVSLPAVSGEPSWSVTCEKWKDANSRN